MFKLARPMLRPNAKPMQKPMGAMKAGAINPQASQNRLRDIMKMLSVKQHSVGGTEPTEKLGMTDGDQSSIDQPDDAMGPQDDPLSEGMSQDGDGSSFSDQEGDGGPTTGDDSASGDSHQMQDTNYSPNGNDEEKPGLFNKPHKGMAMMMAIAKKRRGM